MNNTRTIAALEKIIAQSTALRDRLVAADAKAGNAPVPSKKTAAKKTTTTLPAKKKAAKKIA